MEDSSIRFIFIALFCFAYLLILREIPLRKAHGDSSFSPCVENGPCCIYDTVIEPSLTYIQRYVEENFATAAHFR